MGLQTMNALPIGAITIWSGAYNSSFLANFLQANNMPKPNLQDGHKTNHNNSLQIPSSVNFWHFQRGGSVQNPDPTGARGGLFEKGAFTFHNTLKCINYSKLHFVVK